MGVLAIPFEKAILQTNTPKVSCLILHILLTSQLSIGTCAYSPCTQLPHSFQMAELQVSCSSSRCHDVPHKNLPFPLLTGLTHPCTCSEELRNYRSKWQYITLPADYNNIVNYCWSFTKLEVKDDCFFGTGFWNTSILTLETIAWNQKRAAWGFCHSAWTVQRTAPLKGEELRRLPKSRSYNGNPRQS